MTTHSLMSVCKMSAFKGHPRDEDTEFLNGLTSHRKKLAYTEMTRIQGQN